MKDDTKYAFRDNYSNGLTMRDWFASQALGAAFSVHCIADGADHLANMAYEVADAMMVARDK